MKKGKLASKPDSYKPVSLTSCVVKTTEHKVANRLAFLTEREGMLRKGVPERLVRWCWGFLRNRQARVRLDGTKGHV